MILTNAFILCLYALFTDDPKAILKKIKRPVREKKPVERIGYKGHLNPWTVSHEAPAWIEGHMKQHDTNAILTRNFKRNDRARRQFEKSDVVQSDQMLSVLNDSHYHRNDLPLNNDKFMQ